MESAALEKIIRRCDGHQLDNVQFAGSFNAPFDQGFSDAPPLEFPGDRQALDFGEFPRIHFDGGETDGSFTRYCDEAVPGQRGQFAVGARQEYLLFDERVKQMANLRYIGFRRLPDCKSGCGAHGVMIGGTVELLS